MNSILATNLPFAIPAGVILVLSGRKLRLRRREHALAAFDFGESARQALRDKRPELNEAQLALAWNALRQYFRICLRAGQRQVPMPSQLADDAWHVLILDTRRYARLCETVFGRFLHHQPGEAPAATRLARRQVEHNRAWRIGRAFLKPHGATQLPLLFALDEHVGIADGFRYHAPDPARLRQASSDGGSGCSGGGGHGGCSGHSGCSGSCSGGCSGGCGGGGGD